MGTSIESLLTHRDWVRRVARALVSSDAEAKDVEQEAWLRAVVSPPTGEGKAKAWFRTVLRRVARDRWRTSSRREDREARIEPPSPSAPTADLVAEAEAHRLVVNAALALPEPYREAIVLRYFHELPAAEIAERLDIPLETVRTRVKRAIERLRHELDGRHGGDRRAWLGAMALLLPTTAKAGVAMKAGLVAAAVAATVLGTIAFWPRAAEEEPVVETPTPVVAAAPEVVEEEALVEVELPPEPTPPALTEIVEEGEHADLDAPPPPPPPPALVLFVIDPRSRPVHGATVSLHPMRSRDEIMKAIREQPWPFAWLDPLPAFFRGKTDAAGEAPVPDLPAGWVKLQVAADGFAPVMRYPDVTEGGRCRVILQPAMKLEGSVRLRGGAPIAGATVLCSTGAPPSRTKTDDRGAFRIAGVPLGPTKIWAHLPEGLTVVSPTIDTRRIRRHDFVLDLGAKVRGRIVDRHTGKGIGGARVTVSVGRSGRDAGSFVAVTTSAMDGRYAFDRLPRGRFRGFQVAAEGYLPPRAGTFPWEEPLRRGRSLIRDILLERGTIVTGEVRYQDGEPVPGASVGLDVKDWDENPKVVTDRRGRFRFPAVKPGTGKFFVRGPGFYLPDGQRGWRYDMAPDSLRIEVPESGEVRKVLYVSRGAVVEGVVRDAKGDPQPGVDVRTEPYGGSHATSGIDGRFRLTGVPPGENICVREVYDLRYGGRSEPFRVRDDEIVAGIVVVTRNPNETGVSGRVHVARASLPADLRLGYATGGHPNWRSANPVPVAPDGSFRIEGLRPGDHELLAIAEGYGDAVVSVRDLEDGEFRTDIAIRLFPAESISGRVVGRDGEGIAGAALHVVPWDAKRPSGDHGPNGPVRAFTGESGRFTVEGLAPGRHWICVDLPGFVETTVLADAGDDILIEPRRGRVIAGILLDADTGKPAANVTVTASPRSGASRPHESHWFTRSDPDGRFVLDTLREGSHELRIAEPDHARPEDPEYVRHSRTVLAGTQNLKIYVVPGAVIEGRVLGGDRQPLGHIRVASRRLPHHSTWTRHDGTFRLARLQPGKHELHIYDQDGRGLVAIRKKGVPAGTRDLLFVMESGPSISGVVVDPDGKAPTGRGSVGFALAGSSRFRRCRLEKDGTFRSPPLKAGTVYDLRAKGFDDTIGVVVRRVRAGEEGVRMYLRRGGTISGRVIDENGDPAPGGMYVSAYANEARGSVVPQGDRPSTRTNEDGTFVLRGVGDFTFHVHAAVSGGGGWHGVRTEAAKRVRPGKRDLELRVVRGVPFSGCLVDGQGQPVVCALQRWQHNGSGQIGMGGRSSDEGRFRWSSVRPGPIRLVAVIHGRKIDLGTFTAPAEDVVITVE